MSTHQQEIVRIASMVDVLMYISASTAVSLTIGIPEHCQSAINGRKRRNGAAHMGVGRLLSLADLDGVQGRGCMNNARGEIC